MSKKAVELPNGDWVDAVVVVDAVGVNVDNLPQTLAYTGPNGALSSITAGPDEQGKYYKQTLTYTGNNVTGISAWVLQ